MQYFNQSLINHLQSNLIINLIENLYHHLNDFNIQFIGLIEILKLNQIFEIFKVLINISYFFKQKRIHIIFYFHFLILQVPNEIIDLF